MTEEEKEAIKLLKKDITDCYYRSIDVRNAVRVALNYIEKLQKELEEKTTILMAGADKVKQLEKENHQLIDEKIDQIFKGVEEEVLEEMREEVRTLREENQRIKDTNVELNTYASAWKTTAKELKEENAKLKEDINYLTNQLKKENERIKNQRELLDEFEKHVKPEIAEEIYLNGGNEEDE